MSGIGKIIIIGGVIVIGLIFMTFFPYIVGGSAGSYDLEKYNGSSEEGNQTVRTITGTSQFFMGIYSLGNPLLILGAVLLVIIVIVVFFSLKVKSRRK